MLAPKGDGEEDDEELFASDIGLLPWCNADRPTAPDAFDAAPGEWPRFSGAIGAIGAAGSGRSARSESDRSARSVGLGVGSGRRRCCSDDARENASFEANRVRVSSLSESRGEGRNWARCESGVTLEASRIEGTLVNDGVTG